MLYLNDFISDRKEAEKDGKKLTENEKIIIEKGYGVSGIVFFKGLDIELYPIPKNAEKVSNTLYYHEHEEQNGQVTINFYLMGGF